MTKHSCRTASIFSLIPMLLHPLWSTPQTNLNLPRFPVAYSFHITAYDLPRLPVAYSFPHQSLRPNKASLSITLSLTATYTIAYDLSRFQSNMSKLVQFQVFNPQTTCKSVQYNPHSNSPSLRPNHQSLYPDLRNAVSPIGYLRHPGKTNRPGHLSSSGRQILTHSKPTAFKSSFSGSTSSM